MIVILPGVRQYLIMSLICISLIVRDIEHLSKSWLTISMSSLEKYLFRCSSHFLIRLFFWHWFVRVVHIFWKLICQFHCFQIFYPIPLVDLLLIVSFVVQKLLISFYLFIFAFISFTLRDCSKKVPLWFMSKNVLPMFSSWSFIVSCHVLLYHW